MCLWWGNVRESMKLQNLGGDGRIILKLIFKLYDGELERIVLAHNK